MRSIMSGIRNPKKEGEEANPWNTDNGLAQCLEVWVNELRLTDFDQSGGWAAGGRLKPPNPATGRGRRAGQYSTPVLGHGRKPGEGRPPHKEEGDELWADTEKGA